jgi:aspartokinase-like uncharacterized kinase
LSASLVIVKLGGSYAGSPLLRAWLRAVEAAAGRVVLVPGGGPFADAVRTMQPMMGYDDEAADAMAMLAMAQVGLALCSLGTLLVLVESVEAIQAALDGARVPVWSPLTMVKGEAGLPASWDVTSDSLALWLAWRLSAAALLLVKQRGIAGDIAGLSRDKVLDAHFPHLHATHPCTVFLAGPGDVPAAGLDPDRLPGVRLLDRA